MSWRVLRIAAAVAAALATLVLAGELVVVQPAVQAAGPLAPDGLEQLLRLRLVAAAGAGALAVAGWSLWAGAVRRRCEERSARLRIETIGMVAHDLRSPLTGIALAAGRLERSAASEERRQMRAWIERECGRVADVADDILSACCDDPQDRIAPATERLPELLDDVARRVRTAHGATIEIDVPPELQDAVADVRVARAIANLAENAARHAEAVPVRVRAVRAVGAIEVTVEDDGCGFAPDFSIGAFRTGLRPGRAGLGLASALRGARQLGGSLRVGARAGGGASVSLRFPDGAAR